MIKIERNTSYGEIRRSRETIQKSGAKNKRVEIRFCFFLALV